MEPRPTGAPLGKEAGWPLAWRLLLPLGALALATCLVVGLLMARTISLRMDADVDARVERLADTLVASGLLLDGDLLLRVRDVAGVEVATVGAGGRVLSSTLDDERARDLVARAEGGAREWRDPGAGERYRIAFRDGAVLGRGTPARLVVASSTRATDKLKADLARATALVIAGALVTALAVGLVVVGSATRPVRELARAARELGRGALDRRVPAGGGREIAALAREFNAMVDELDRSRAELVRSEKLAAAGRMAAGVAHELRNPLSSIRMNLQLLDRDTDGRLSDELGDVVDELDRLDLVLGNLLDLTTPPRLRARPHDLNAIVSSALRLTARKLAHLGVAVREELAPDLPEVPVDPLKVKQALLNVILNAVESMGDGGELRVGTRRAGECVELLFEDTGSGIDAGEAERLFEPFHSTKAGGAGLGLHMVRGVMELHGGTARLEARETGGTRCVLTLPAPAAPAPQGVPTPERELA